jgi:hypothetical protein
VTGSPRRGDARGDSCSDGQRRKPEGGDAAAANQRHRVHVALACLWLFLMVAGFAAIDHRADNLLALYVVVSATALTPLVRWMWQRRPG